MSTNASERSYRPEDVRSIGSVDRDADEASEEMWDIVAIAYQHYNSLEDSGQDFAVALSHYAGLTSDCFEYLSGMEEAAENNLDPETRIVSYFSKNLQFALIDRHNQANLTRSWYGIADADRELWEEPEEDIVTDTLSEEILHMNPVELVDRVDSRSQEVIERIENLPDSYIETITDFDEMGNQTANVDERFRTTGLTRLKQE